MQIGSFRLPNNVIAAPMAGVSDKPFRQVCRQNGAGMVVSEMLTSQSDLAHTTKSRFRADLHNEPEPRVIQIVGTEPSELAQAARLNVANGAQVIDINMGCPAKKVCNKAAGSALLSNEQLVADILSEVVRAVDVPVTVKIRTGADPHHRNGVTIAKIAEQAGVAAITVHGRTRQCKFVGNVEYDTIAHIKQSVHIPVVANGDIDSPAKAKMVLEQTGADAVMLGRAAQGQPWLLHEVAHYLATGKASSPLSLAQKRVVVLRHIAAIHAFYGPHLGIRFARKHIKWYLQKWQGAWPTQTTLRISTTECCYTQLELLEMLLNSAQDTISAAA